MSSESDRIAWRSRKGISMKKNGHKQLRELRPCTEETGAAPAVTAKALPGADSNAMRSRNTDNKTGSATTAPFGDPEPARKVFGTSRAVVNIVTVWLPEVSTTNAHVTAPIYARCRHV